MRRRPIRLQTLDLYVLRRFLVIYAANLLSFTLLFVLIDTVSNFEDFLRGNVGLWGFLEAWTRYYATVTPVIFCQVLGPVVSVSAGLFAVTTFQRTNEFTPILATGRSYQRTLFPILVASVFISGVVFLIQEMWIPRTVAAIREAVESREKDDEEEDVKHFDTLYGNLIVFRKYERYARRATGVLILPVSRSEGRQSFIQAQTAEWRNPLYSGEGATQGYWLLRDGLIQEYDENGRLIIHEPESEWEGATSRLYRSFVEHRLKSNLIPQDMERKETVQMSLGELWRKAEKAPDQKVWAIRYYSRFAYAFTNFTLVLIGLPIIVFFGNRNILFGAILAVAIATLYFVLNSMCQDLGVQGHLPAALAGGLAPILFLSLGATLYREMRS